MQTDFWILMTSLASQLDTQAPIPAQRHEQLLASLRRLSPTTRAAMLRKMRLVAVKLNEVVPSPSMTPIDRRTLSNQFRAIPLRPAGPWTTDRSINVLTNTQIIALLTGKELRLKNDGRSVSPSGRFPFSVKQPLAAVPNDGSPPSALCDVQCHDLSAKNLRYFVSEPPTSDKVIIGLGMPSPVRWVVAEIEDHRSTYMYGKTGFLVTANILASFASEQSADLLNDSRELAASG